MRLIEDFLAKANTGRCRDFRETADVIAKVQFTYPFRRTDAEIAFKIYLNITPTVTSWASDEKSFSLVFDENPLADFVELPEDGPYEKVWYSNVLCGVIRGALEMVRLSQNISLITGTIRRTGRICERCIKRP